MEPLEIAADAAVKTAMALQAPLAATAAAAAAALQHCAICQSAQQSPLVEVAQTTWQHQCLNLKL
jgi:hypothetical protein